MRSLCGSAMLRSGPRTQPAGRAEVWRTLGAFYARSKAPASQWQCRHRTRRVPAAREAREARAEAASRPEQEQQQSHLFSATCAHSASWMAACIASSGSWLLVPPVLAAEAVKYEPGSGSDVLKTLAGAAYIILVVVYFVRLFRKRAQTATGEVRQCNLLPDDMAAVSDAYDLRVNLLQRLASPAGAAASAGETSDDDEEAPAPRAEATPLACFMYASRRPWGRQRRWLACRLTRLLCAHLQWCYPGRSYQLPSVPFQHSSEWLL